MRLITLLLITILVSNQNLLAQENSTSTNSIKWEPVAGQHYREIKDGKANDNLPTQVGITFYFWPGSPSSYQLEHALQNWHVLHSDIRIQRIPIVLRPQWRLLAKAWLVAVVMDKDNSLSFLNNLYQAIHQDSLSLTNIDELIQYIKPLEVEPLDFVTRFNSIAINQQLQSQQTTASLIPITGVPTVIINNQWYSDASMVQTSAQMIEVINLLITESNITTIPPKL